MEINFNSAYLKSRLGVLKIIQIMIGILCIAIVAYNFNKKYNGVRLYEIFHGEELFFDMMVVAITLDTILMLLTYVIYRSGNEKMHNVVAAILLISSSIALFVVINRKISKDFYKNHSVYFTYMAAGMMELFNGFLYICSIVLRIKMEREPYHPFSN